MTINVKMQGKKAASNFPCTAQTTPVAEDALEAPVLGAGLPPGVGVGGSGVLGGTHLVWHPSMTQVLQNKIMGEKSLLPSGRGACSGFDLLEGVPACGHPALRERAVTEGAVPR